MQFNVGAGLPAIAVDQLRINKLTVRHRRQASSHIDRVHI
ncbi:unnamed protein product [Pseudomonas synxantha]|nr:unnamed protein product [Pseudomonas synxantha]